MEDFKSEQFASIIKSNFRQPLQKIEMKNVECSDYVFQEVCNILSSRIYVGFNLSSFTIENPPSIYLGSLANKFHLFEDLKIKFDESFNESGFNKMTKLLTRILIQGRFLKSFDLSGLG